MVAQLVFIRGPSPAHVRRSLALCAVVLSVAGCGTDPTQQSLREIAAPRLAAMEKEQVRVLYWGDPKKKDTSSGQRVWRKTRFRLHRDGIKYVVHEPDEQGEPVVGVVRFQVSVAHTPFYASEKIAEKSNAYGSPRRVACQFVYHHDGSHWQPAQLRWWWHGPTGQGAEVDPRLRPFFSPTE